MAASSAWVTVARPSIEPSLIQRCCNHAPRHRASKRNHASSSSRSLDDVLTGAVSYSTASGSGLRVRFAEARAAFVDFFRDDAFALVFFVARLVVMALAPSAVSSRRRSHSHAMAKLLRWLSR